MCLGVPMCVREVSGLQVRCEARGVERRASLLLLPERVDVGDWVLVHLGHAVARLSAADAARTWGLLDEMLADDAD